CRQHHRARMAGPASLHHWNRSFRLILVEDEADLARAQSVLLTKNGHEVRWCATAGDALEALGSFQPDLMIIDLGLPGMNGFELARRVRENPALARFPLIAQTGYTDPATRRGAAEAGFDHYAIKPVCWQELSDLLETFLSVNGG